MDATSVLPQHGTRNLNYATNAIWPAKIGPEVPIHSYFLKNL